MKPNRLFLSVAILLSFTISSHASVPYSFIKGELAYQINEDGTTVSVCQMRWFDTIDMTDWYNQLSYPEEYEDYHIYPPYPSLTGKVVIPESVSFEGVTYPVTGITIFCFAACVNITSVIIPNSVPCINWSSFEACFGLTKVTLPSNMKYIHRDGFRNCKNLVSITIPEGFDLIDYGAFAGCSSLPSINIPSTVKALEEQAFVGCVGLENIYCKIKDPVNIQYYADPHKTFYYEDPSTFPFSTCVLHVPKGLKEVYQNTEPWNLFNNIVDDIDDEIVSGDINGDNIVDVDDVNAVINLILFYDQYKDRYPGDGDLDGNGMVDVDDVNAIINIILGK